MNTKARILLAQLRQRKEIPQIDPNDCLGNYVKLDLRKIEIERYNIKGYMIYTKIDGWEYRGKFSLLTDMFDDYLVIDDTLKQTYKRSNYEP